VVLLLVLMAAPVHLVIHALGQTAIARVTGDADAAFPAYPERSSGPPWIRAASYDPGKLSSVGQVLAPLGGLLCTQVAALGLLAASARRSRKARTYLGAFGGVFLVDVPVQVARAVIDDVGSHPHPSGIDLADLMAVVHGWTGASFVGMKAILLIFSIGYCLVVGQMLLRRFRGWSWAP
jgi:hypothetical protein